MNFWAAVAWTIIVLTTFLVGCGFPPERDPQAMQMSLEDVASLTQAEIDSISRACWRSAGNAGAVILSPNCQPPESNTFAPEKVRAMFAK